MTGEPIHRRKSRLDRNWKTMLALAAVVISSLTLFTADRWRFIDTITAQGLDIRALKETSATKEDLLVVRDSLYAGVASNREAIGLLRSSVATKDDVREMARTIIDCINDNAAGRICRF